MQNNGKIYAYSFPSDPTHIKVGYTTQTVKQRIKQQIGTSNKESPTILGEWPACDKYYNNFTDKEVHQQLILAGHPPTLRHGRPTEWFQCSIQDVEYAIKQLGGGKKIVEKPRQGKPWYVAAIIYSTIFIILAKLMIIYWNYLSNYVWCIFIIFFLITAANTKRRRRRKNR